MAVGGALFSGGGRAAPASKALVEVTSNYFIYDNFVNDIISYILPSITFLTTIINLQSSIYEKSIFP